jgi:hypothetical protein
MMASTTAAVNPYRYIPIALAAASAFSFAAPASAQTPDSAPVARIALDAPGLRWLHQHTAHADLYVLAGSAAERVSDALADASERAIVDNLRWLRAADADTPRVRLFFVGTRQQMAPFTGGTSGGWAETREGTAFFVANDSVRPPLRHEVMHLLSWRLWGPPSSRWLSEGLGVIAAGACRGHSVDEVTAALDRAGRLVSLDVLRNQFVVTGETGAAHYFEAASLATYIDRVYGRDTLRALWSRGGLVRARETLGVPLETLERRWRATIALTDAQTTWAALWPELRSHGCE